jgi:hypothetical protein
VCVDFPACRHVLACLQHLLLLCCQNNCVLKRVWPFTLQYNLVSVCEFESINEFVYSVFSRAFRFV